MYPEENLSFKTNACSNTKKCWRMYFPCYFPQRESFKEHIVTQIRVNFLFLSWMEWTSAAFYIAITLHSARRALSPTMQWKMFSKNNCTNYEQSSLMRKPSFHGSQFPVIWWNEFLTTENNFFLFIEEWYWLRIFLSCHRALLVCCLNPGVLPKPTHPGFGHSRSCPCTAHKDRLDCINTLRFFLVL